MLFFFQLVQVFHLYIADVPVYIDDDGYGNGCFASGNPDGEQGEEKAFHLFGEEITVEHGKVDVHWIQDQLDWDQHGEQVPPGDEPVNSREKPDRADQQVILHV